MATLKGAYQRFVTSIIRLWKREEPAENPEQAEEAEEENNYSPELLSDDEEPPEDNNNTDDFILTREEDPSTSAPDLLEEGRKKTPEKTSETVKKKKSNLRRGLSVLKITRNRSDPHLANPYLADPDPDLIESSIQPLFRPRNYSSPLLGRKQAPGSLLRPVSIFLDRPSHSERPAYLQLQPPTPDSSCEPSPVQERRDLSTLNLLHDHPPVVLRRHLGHSRLLPTPSPTRLRREHSTSNLFRTSPKTHPARRPRPKSVNDFLSPDYQPEKHSKLKKSSSFLKLSPALFRKHSPRSPDIPEYTDKDSKNPEKQSLSKSQDKQSFQRPRTFTLASKFSKFASKRIDGTLRKRTKPTVKSLKITIMQNIDTSTDTSMPVEPFLARLRDYNTYYEDRTSLQFKLKQDKDGNPVVDGMLNIYWGLKRAIRLQMQDSGVKIRPQSQLAFPQAQAVRRFEEITTGVPRKGESVDIVLKNEKLSGTILRRKLGKAVENTTYGDDVDPVISIENGILGDTRQRTYDRRRMALRLKNGGEKVHVNTQDEDGHLRQKSVILRKRLTNRSARKRLTINGHAYDYQSSVFTPAYASVTNVRVTSRSSCDDVIRHLLNKFRVENTSEEFSLYVVKETGERRELSRSEYPLITRVLSGPNEEVCKIFVMDRHMHEDISSEVAQYIKLDMNILTVFVKKFAEEEERETKKLRERYELYREMLEKRIKELSET